MRVLVTGASGMLAQALLPALEAGGHAAQALSHRDADITRLDDLLAPARAFRPDWVFNLAAYTKVDDCESHPDDAYLVNALGARNAALASLDVGAGLLTVSTDYVFDGAGTRPYREYDSPGPRSVYGATKLAGERAVKEIQPRHLVVRTSWLYGTGGPNFPDTILKRARSGEPLRVVGDQRGSPTYTVDLAPALVRLAELAQFGTYHCTNSGDCSWHDFAVHLVRAAGLEVPVERIESSALSRPAPRPAYSVLSNLLYERVSGRRMPAWQDAADRYLASPTGPASRTQSPLAPGRPS